MKLYASEIQGQEIPDLSEYLGIEGRCELEDYIYEGVHWEVWFYDMQEELDFDLLRSWLEDCEEAGLSWETKIIEKHSAYILDGADRLIMIPEYYDTIMLMKNKKLLADDSTVAESEETDVLHEDDYDCILCHDTGYYDCLTCDGWGICTACFGSPENYVTGYGTGNSTYVTCKACNGSEECPKCGGSGIEACMFCNSQ